MLDLTIKQLEKIREALTLLALQGNGDPWALKLADQLCIIIAARKAETAAAQGIMHVELKGR